MAEDKKSMKFDLNVEGMTCGHCVSTIEKAVGNVSGVESVSVDLAKKLVSVVCENDPLTHEAIKRAVTSAGYQLAD